MPSSIELGFFVRPDTLDFRDRMFRPSLVEVPSEVPLTRFAECKVPVLNQGKAWVCTGFALATVVHYLLRRRATHPDMTLVSPAMLFEMARRYDEYPDEHFQGSSARGAMKGWHLHGVCAEKLWPYRASRLDRRLTAERARDSATRPLGAYFRVNHRDLVAMHCALAEVGVLYAVANVHQGWIHPGRGGRITARGKILGSHAIVIVAYDNRGFWFQNSWGRHWGADGFGFLEYDDWLENGVDTWVARLGVPTQFDRPAAAAKMTAAGSGFARAQTMRHLRSHIVRIHNDGYLQTNDVYGTSADDLTTIFDEDFRDRTARWKRKRLMLFAGAGLAPLGANVQRGVADYRAAMLEQEIYPLAFVWRTGFWETVGALLRQALSQRQPENGPGSDTDFLLDRMDDALEPLARELGGKLQWDEIKRTALQATTRAQGGVRLTLQRIARLMERDKSIELHLVGHGAGAVMLAPAVQLFTTKGRVTSGPLRGRIGMGKRIESCVLWAPACTVQLFHDTFFYAIRDRLIRRFLLMTLTDRAERSDNCAGVYRKSLLYLVSHALESEFRVPGDESSDGAEIVGMEKFLLAYENFKLLLRRASVQWVRSPNTDAGTSHYHSTARHHGDFDDDHATLTSTTGWILDRPPADVSVAIHRSASSARRWRQSL